MIRFAHVMMMIVSCQILITESPLSSKENREKIAQIVFETFKAPGLCIANSAVMSLFCSGRTRGVTVRAMPRLFLSMAVSKGGFMMCLRYVRGRGMCAACIYTKTLAGYSHSTQACDDLMLQLEVGGGVTHAVPIFEGFALPHATVRLEVAGQDITHALRKRLADKGQNVTVRVSLETLKPIHLTYRLDASR